MSFVCNLCQDNFVQKSHLIRHLKKRRCKSELLHDLVKLNNLLNKVSIEIHKETSIINNLNKKSAIYNSDIQDNKENIKIINISDINVNTINELNLDFIEINEMKTLIDNYDTNKNRLSSLLSDYIKRLICNREHPENHCIKYISKRNGIFSLYLKEKNGIKEHIVDDCKNICNTASEYIYNYIYSAFKKCLKFYKKDEEFQNLYEDTIIQFKQDLNIDIVSKSLKLCLQGYILNDKTMKFNNN